MDYYDLFTPRVTDALSYLSGTLERSIFRAELFWEFAKFRCYWQ